MRLTNRVKQAGATGYILLWLLWNSDSGFGPDFSAARLHIVFGKSIVF
jgi:hypothetical protein